jgi:hypothetical protein
MGMVVRRSANINKNAAKNNPSPYGTGKVKRIDRRKNKRDRRKSVRDGVFVSLSFQKERRVLKDRRKPYHSSQAYTPAA